MHPLLMQLQGGDRRSIGKSNAIVQEVLAKPALFTVLMHGIVHDDALISMRCADAAEKLSVLHPEWLCPFKALLLNEYSQIDRAEVRWHVAAMLPRLPLTSRERTGAMQLLSAIMNDKSSIVKTFALQAMHELAMQDETLLPQARAQIEHALMHGTAAMRARAKKLLKLRA